MPNETQPLRGETKAAPGGVLTTAQAAKYYFELTRLHKFPLGNILVIWPCSTYLFICSSIGAHYHRQSGV